MWHSGYFFSACPKIAFQLNGLPSKFNPIYFIHSRLFSQIFRTIGLVKTSFWDTLKYWNFAGNNFSTRKTFVKICELPRPEKRVLVGSIMLKIWENNPECMKFMGLNFESNRFIRNTIFGHAEEKYPECHMDFLCAQFSGHYTFLLHFLVSTNSALKHQICPKNLKNCYKCQFD